MDDYIAAHAATKSTAARMDETSRASTKVPGNVNTVAGTQASPVDKFFTDVQAAAGASARSRRGKGLAGPANAVGARTANTKPATSARPRGRPRTGFDKAAYDRDYQRKRRAKEKT